MATDEEVRARCTPCHKLPPPDILPRSAWRDEMVRMMLIQEGVPEPAGATSFLPLSPDWLRLWRYYDARAPEKLPEPESWPAASRAAGAVREAARVRHGSDRRAGHRQRPAVRRRRRQARSTSSPARCGPAPCCSASPRMRHALKPIARLSHPAHIEPVDLDKDGRGDFLVADLGSFQPADHADGAVYWLRGRADGSYLTIAAGDQAGRAPPMRAPPTSTATATSTSSSAASAGARTGNVTLLENKTTNWRAPVFVAEADRPAHRRHPRADRRHRQGRQARLRRAAGAAARVGDRVRQPRQGPRVHAEDDLRGAAPELGLVGHRPRRPRQGRRHGRPARPTATPSTTSC